MDWKDKKIGYVPYLPDLSQPGDRRRFPHFARRNNVLFEVASTTNYYDIIILTAPSNLSKWLRYKKKYPKTKFIFEMTDSLLDDFFLFSRIFKGIGRYFLRKEDLLFLNYKTLIKKWLKISDLVVCSNTKTRKALKKYNKSVTVSLDYMSNEIKFQKENFRLQGKLKLVWEGQGSVLHHFRHFQDMLMEVSSFAELHVITDEKYPTFGGAQYKETRQFLKKLSIETYFHKWEINKNYEELIKFDCGIIPINKKNRLAWHKPANKLLSFWFAGLPTVVSDTPAYKEIMDASGQKLYCGNDEEWVATLKSIHEMTSEARMQIGNKGYQFAQENFSENQIDKVWFQIFEDVLS